MLSVRFRISGADAVNKVLKQLPDRMRRRVLSGANRAGAVVIRDAIVAATPVGTEDPHPKYGRGRDNIRVTQVGAKTVAMARHAIHTGRAFWLMFYEFGRAHQPARPFIRPALDRAAKQAILKVGEQLGKGIEREARALAGTYRRARKKLGL